MLIHVLKLIKLIAEITSQIVANVKAMISKDKADIKQDEQPPKDSAQ